MEQELQLLRPQGLEDSSGNANITSTASSSTELRPGSTGVDRMATAPQEVGTPPESRDREVPLSELDASGRLDLSGQRTSSAQGTAPTQVVENVAAQTPLSAQGDADALLGGQSEASGRLGMRPGERLIVEEMKNLLVGLYEQNQILAEGQKALQRRLEQMENDAMQSASSGGEGEKGSGDHELGWVPDKAPYLGRFIPPEEKGAIDYQAGLEEGLRRAAEVTRIQSQARSSDEILRAPAAPTVPVAPPVDPIAPPRRHPSPHTPNGTRVPSGTPPRTPTPVFGSPNASPQETMGRSVRVAGSHDRVLHPLAQSAEWTAAKTQDAGNAGLGDFWGSMGIGSMNPGSGYQRQEVGSIGMSGLPGLQGRSLEFLRSSGLGQGSTVGASGLFPGNFGGNSGSGGGGSGSGTGIGGLGSAYEPGSSGVEGRNAFAPGDRTWWKLPQLPDPGTEDACIAVSDWLTQIQPIMSDLSDRSWVWWQRVMEVAQSAYVRWQQAGPLEKSLVVCETPSDLLDPRLSRLEARALGMIMESLPGRIKDELVVTKALTSTNAVYRILLAFQPGGLGERQKLISNLQEPGVATTARNCSDQLRRWHRWLGRSQDLGVNPPDPAILLAGLDKLSGVVIGANPQLGFRCNISRTQHQLDFCPTVTSVTAYARLLQAEMETLALSGSDPDLEEPKLTKKQRAAALRKEQSESKGNNKGSEGSGQSAADNNQPGQQAKGGQGGGKGAKGNSSDGTGTKGPCRFYGMKGGCKMGRNCWSYHDFGKASAENRCFNCGATEHRADACGRPRGRPAGKGEEQAPRGESGGNSAPSGSGGKGTGHQNSKGTGSKGEGKQSQVRQVAAESAAASTEGATAVGTDPKVAKASEAHPSQELIAEATKLLKGFRMAAVSVATPAETPTAESAVPVTLSGPAPLQVDSPEPAEEFDSFYLTKVIQDPSKGARGLLDGGATNALRSARNEEELKNCTKTQVALALGHADLFLTPAGTLLSPGHVSPIVPMGVLVAELGCRVSWEGETCTVTHPRRGRLPVVMINRCPELSATITEELISEIEDRRARIMQRALRLKALGVSSCPVDGEGHALIEDMLEWLRKLSPDCPEGVMARVPPFWRDDLNGADVPFNRRVRRAVQRADKVVIHMFAGKTKPQDLGHLPSSVYVLSVDLDQGADVLTDGLFQYLIELCASGKVVAIIGGPPCATLTRLREKGLQDGGPQVLRDRAGLGRFGTMRRELSRGEQQLTDNHTVMYLRMFLLHHVAHGASEEGVLFVLENPADPADYLRDNREHASVWAWPEIHFLEKEKGMFRATFSQGQLGHSLVKPTTLLVNDWGLYLELHGRHGSSGGVSVASVQGVRQVRV